MDEDKVYSDKDLRSFTCPDLPTDAVGWRTFWNGWCAELSKLDRTEEDLLLEWGSAAKDMLGDVTDVMRSLDNTSQGLVRLDRYLGQVLTVKGKDHSVFGARFNGYVETCHAVPASGMT